mmetsp:Transcript_12878/g.29641  ORF Transcript_12878/g.29641 Transcript_12878/m.29641 type:complete len:89 (-) Transcript_12878:137-403(-)
MTLSLPVIAIIRPWFLLQSSFLPLLRSLRNLNFTPSSSKHVIVQTWSGMTSQPNFLVLNDSLPWRVFPPKNLKSSLQAFPSTAGLCCR